MSTITIPTIASGIATAETLNAAYYSGSTTSLKALNGHLTNTNISDAITSEHIRDQTLANGKMVGMTCNLDFPVALFSKDEEVPNAFITIPGATQTFYLPYNPSLVVFTWQIIATNSQRTATATNLRIMKAFLDDEVLSTQKRFMKACRTGANATTGARSPLHDFAWTGHAVRTGLTKGFLTVGLKLFSGSDTTRVRVRSMKVLWFK